MSIMAVDATTPGPEDRASAEIFGLVRSRPSGFTKTDLAQLLGLSRTTINQRLGPLLAAQLLVASGPDASRGGRPAESFAVNLDRGVVLVADMGASGVRAAICDLSSAVELELSEESDITAGPVAVLTRVGQLFDSLLEQMGKSDRDVLGIGVDVPGPVHHASGRIVTPPIMTGWHDFDIRSFVGKRFGCPVVVEKDANAMASGELRLSHPDIADLVFVKFGTGIGTGIIARGQIYRGADGAAGDIGHIQVELEGIEPPLCRCGRSGCIESHAGGWAIQRDLRAIGLEVESVKDVVLLARDGQPDAARLYRRAAMILGSAISDIVNTLNPSVVVVGGQLAVVDDVLFAVVRESVYRRSLPLATRRLEILPSRLGDQAGVHGLASLVLDAAFSPVRIAQLLEAGRSVSPPTQLVQ